MIIDSSIYVWRMFWRLTLHHPVGLVLIWISMVIIKTFVSSPNIIYLNIDHRNYSCKFLSSYNFQSWNQCPHSYTILVEISYLNISTQGTNYPLDILQIKTVFFQQTWFNFLNLMHCLYDDWKITMGIELLPTVNFLSSMRGNYELTLKCNNIEDNLMTKPNILKYFP